MAATFSRNGFALLMICCVRTHTLIACMVGRNTERDQLAWAAFHVLRGSAIVQNNKHVRALKKMAAEFQQELDRLLRAVNDKNVRIVIHKPVVSFVAGKVGHIDTI